MMDLQNMGIDDKDKKRKKKNKKNLENGIA